MELLSPNKKRKKFEISLYLLYQSPKIYENWSSTSQDFLKKILECEKKDIVATRDGLRVLQDMKENKVLILHAKTA